MKISLLFVLIAQIDQIVGETIIAEEPQPKLDRYQPTWDSLDTRPLPDWFDKAKIGIFLHWGVYAVPGFGGSAEWFWSFWKGSGQQYVKFMENNYKPDFTYQDFAKDFTAEFFDPAQWAKLFKASGAKYVVLTSKHHEGYTLWPSTYSFSWNAMDVGPHRDLLGELTEAVRNESLRMGVYYSLYEWFNPRYQADKKASFTTQGFTDEKMIPEMIELVNSYEPDVVWVDGDWDADDDYFRSKEFLAWLYNDSPVRDKVVVNDRWGKGIPCKHGDFYSCKDRYNPGVLQDHKWENAMTIGKNTWGYRRNTNYNDYLTSFELIKTVVETVSCGGNILINVGPTKEGTIIPIFQERLLDLGRWLEVNGEAIYETQPWTVQNDTLSKVWYTSKPPGAVYAISLEWPRKGWLYLGSVDSSLFNSGAEIELLGYNGTVKWKITEKYAIIKLPEKAEIESQWAWAFKITNFN